MKQPPRRPTEGVFNRRMLEQVLVGGLTMGLTCLAAWAVLLSSGLEEAVARNNLLTLLVGMLVALGIFVLATELPLMQELLRRNSLSIGRWLALAATASVVSFAMELYQRVRRGKPASRSFP